MSLPEPPQRWGIDPVTGEEDPERAIPEMCDFAAKALAAGEIEAVRFFVMQNEVEAVKAYMREHHPEVVEYWIDYPSPRIKGS